MSGLGDDDYLDIATFLGGHEEEEEDDEGLNATMMTITWISPLPFWMMMKWRRRLTMTWTSHHQCYTGFSIKCDAAIAPQYSDNDMVRKLFKRRICSLKHAVYCVPDLIPYKEIERLSNKSVRGLAKYSQTKQSEA